MDTGLERGLHVDHTTIYRWVQRYAPELDQRCRPHLKLTTDSCTVDETCVKVIRNVNGPVPRGGLKRRTPSSFLLSATQDAQATKRFFSKALMATHTVTPRVITVDKTPAYLKALSELKAADTILAQSELRQVKYLNNLIEQDHRFIKRLVKPGLGFGSFEPAWQTLLGYEVMIMIRKGQLQGGERRHSRPHHIHRHLVWRGSLS